VSRLGFLAAAVVGLAVPVALALAVYVASAGTLAEPVEGTSLPSERIARPSVTTTAAERAARRPAAGRERDVSGPCDEAEHANDPRCTGAATAEDDDRSGGSGSSGSSDGSSSSGSGSSGSDGSDGDDDSSGQGRGRGRSGSSGSGSSGSGSSGSGSGDD
jgi:hypothetical protein